MKRLIPFAALFCLPLAVVGCAPDADDDVDVVDPVTGAVDPVTGDIDDVDVDPGAMPVESGSGTSAVAPAGDALAAADFGGQVVFSIPEMTCEFTCAPDVEAVLASLPGVEGVETDVDARTATIQVGEGFDVEAAKAKLASETRFKVDNVL